MSMYEDEIQLEEGDPSVPPELLELHMDLEDAGVTARQFKEAFGGEVRH